MADQVIYPLFLPYGDYEVAPTITDGSTKPNLTGGRKLIQTPTNMDVETTAYTDRGILVSLNVGVLSRPEIGNMRSLFLKANLLYGYVNKPMSQWSESECDGFGEWLFNARGPFGFVCGETDEDGFWNVSQAPAQARRVLQSLTNACNARGVVNGGLSYASDTTIEPNVTNRTDFAAGMASPAAARGLMAGFEWEPIRFWSQELYKTGKVPLVQAYVLYEDAWRQMSMTRMRMELTRVAMADINTDPSTINLFVNTRANYNNTYTEAWRIDLGGGSYSIGYDFPGTNANLQLAQVGLGFDRGKYVYNWDNPYGFGMNKSNLQQDYLRPGDNFPLYKVFGPAASSARTPSFQPAPKNPNTTYGYPYSPTGMLDLGTSGAVMHGQGRGFVNADLLPTAWRMASGSATPMNTGNGYWPDTIYDRKPHVELAASGNNRLLVINDFSGQTASNGTTGVIEVPNGNGTYKSIEYPVGVRYQRHYTV